MVQAVIFDINGTIIDSVDFHIQAWKRAFEKFDKEISYQLIRPQIGKGADDMLPMFFSKDELHRFGRELEQYRGKLFLFERIKQEGKKISLASTAKEKEINIYKEIARINDLIDSEVCSEEVKKSKPHSDICATALHKLGNVAAHQVIAVGDTEYDAEAAGKINVRAIGLLCGGGNREELNRVGCVAIYKHPADLLDHYEISPLASNRDLL